jgi:hypothetical protein
VIRLTLPAPVPFVALLLGAASSACKSDAPARTPENVERTELVAQPCPELALGSEPIDAANARLFVEIVDVGAQPLPTPLGRWLDDNAVTFHSSANLVAFPDVPTSGPWAQCVDAVCADAKRSVSVTARLPERASEPIELALHIEDTAAEGGSPRTLLDTTLRALSQEPAVVPSGSELGSGSLVVTAYVLRRFDDLHRLLECKERQKARSPRSPSTEASDRSDSP